tara:strand:+ start:2942 stop:3064 length:123 start_codon:yes stop_codon:yes gene_type:complete
MAGSQFASLQVARAASAVIAFSNLEREITAADISPHIRTP